MFLVCFYALITATHDEVYNNICLQTRSLSLFRSVADGSMVLSSQPSTRFSIVDRSGALITLLAGSFSLMLNSCISSCNSFSHFSLWYVLFLNHSTGS